MNYMEDVAKMLGVELGEYFEVYRCDGIYFLSYNGLYHNQSGLTAENVLSKLLSGEYHIKRKHWKPKYQERYWSIGPGGVLEPGSWLNDFIDIAMYKLGNCYHTVQEAEANRDKWISFYASDEALEV